MNIYLTDKLQWALSKEAKEALEFLINKGIDQDVAFELLHLTVKEEDMYNLDGNDAA